ncbi:MAG TPA: hemerythrin domain-containing protein [Pseudobdellovibrionaceae bacterium]|nr:hemerythrin domain-containing protein [Pseudobdellovibrionaceae bacterium]
MTKTARTASNSDIIQLILEDHKSLKKLIRTLKDTDKDISERMIAFEEFAPLLVTHAKPEEEVLYRALKKEEDLREEGFEGDVEHGLADQLLEEAKRTTEDEDLWSARVKVLAELVEHHIEEEEETMLPKYRQHSSSEDRSALGQKFLRLKEKLEEMGGDDTVPEESVEQHVSH